MSRIDKWFYGSCLAILILAGVAQCGRAEAANISFCSTSWSGVAIRLAEDYGELPIMSWVEVWEAGTEKEYTLTKTLFANPDMHSWTMVFNAVEGATCTMRNGSDVFIYDLGEPS